MKYTAEMTNAVDNSTKTYLCSKCGQPMATVDFAEYNPSKFCQMFEIELGEKIIRGNEQITRYSFICKRCSKIKKLKE